MAEIQKSPDNLTVIDWINQINKDGEGLNEWEVNFMKSITLQGHNHSIFSARQVELIERIYCNRVPLRRFRK